MYLTYRVFMPLISKITLPLRSTTSMEMPYQFSVPHVPFLRTSKAAKGSNCSHLLFKCDENPCT